MKSTTLTQGFTPISTLESASASTRITGSGSTSTRGFAASTSRIDASACFRSVS